MKKTTIIISIVYVVIAISLLSTYLFLDAIHTEKFPTEMDDPIKRIFPNIAKKSIIKFTIEKQVDLDIETISNVFKEVENYPLILPKNIPSIQIINHTDNYVLAKEKFSEQGIATEFLVEHRWNKNQKHYVEILDGDAKNTKIIQTFEKRGNFTKITTEVEIHFKGLLSVFRFIPQQNLIHAANTVLNTFEQYSRGFDDEYEKLVDELYREILLRPSDDEGRKFYSENLKNNLMTIEEIRNNLIDSDEYRELYDQILDDTDDHRFITSIKVGESPIGIDINSKTKKIYVSNNNDDTLSIIDAKENIILDTITVGKGPAGIDINSNTNTIYVTNYYSNTISIIDGNNDLIIEEIGVGDSPRNIAVNSITNMIYVANYFGNSISVIDGKSNSIVTSIGIERPWGISVDPKANIIYVTSKNSADLFMIDGLTNNLSKLEINDSSKNPPLGIESISDSGTIFLTYTNKILVLDKLTMKKTIIPIGKNLVEIEINPNLNLAYVLDTFSNSIFVIDIINFQVIEEIPTQRHPIGITIDQESNMLYVVNEYANSVSIFQPNSD